MNQEADSDRQPPPTAKSPEAIIAEQALRIRRLGMSCGSYVFTFALVCFCWLEGWISFDVVVLFSVLALLINACYFILIKTGLNLRFADPSLTLLQIVPSLFPSYYVMYHLDAGQARAVFFYISIVPAMYGILALNKRQLSFVGLWYVVSYSTLVGLIHLNRPEALDVQLELAQLVAIVLVMVQLAWIGGFINQLRRKLRKQNRELKTTTQKLTQSVEYVSELARRDELTGLYNRRHIFDVLTKECNRVRRIQGSFCVCIVDIDNFKKVNDTYRHQAGDEVLCKVAEVLQEGIRNIDCIGRYGGEEFLIILPQTPLSGALIKSERIRIQVQNLAFPTIAESFQVTISIGVAAYMNEENIDDTILRADEALYHAKANGRNQTVSERQLNSAT